MKLSTTIITSVIGILLLVYVLFFLYWFDVRQIFGIGIELWFFSLLLVIAISLSTVGSFVGGMQIFEKKKIQDSERTQQSIILYLDQTIRTNSRNLQVFRDRYLATFTEITFLNYLVFQETLHRLQLDTGLWNRLEEHYLPELFTLSNLYQRKTAIPGEHFIALLKGFFQSVELHHNSIVQPVKPIVVEELPLLLQERLHHLTDLSDSGLITMMINEHQQMLYKLEPLMDYFRNRKVG
ncbi:MAG: hypothetical protein WCP97_07385 [bacterium]